METYSLEEQSAATSWRKSDGSRGISMCKGSEGGAPKTYLRKSKEAGMISIGEVRGKW